MAYTQTTLGQLITMLSGRLTDTGFKFWTQAELRRYLIEALRTWQAFSAAYTTRVSFNSVSNQLFYDLYTLVPSLAPSITDRDLIVNIQEMLQEPVSATSWTGSEQFTYTMVVEAIQRRRNQFIIETGMVLNESTLTLLSGTYNPALNQAIIDVRRAMWRATPEYYWQLLWRADQFTLATQAASISPGTPSDFAAALEVPVSMLVSPTPTEDGELHLLTVNSGAVLNPASAASILGIPDDLCWVIKFGALADLLVQAGQGQDNTRAQYCESRWKDGIQLARITNLVKTGFISGNSTFLDSIFDIDTGDPTWISSLADAPSLIGVAGNFIALSAIPNELTYPIALDVTYAPQPTSDGAYVPVGYEVLDVIVDYAQHLAQFKEGMSELTPAMDLYKNFVRLAAVQNDRLRAAAQNFDVLSNRSLREGKQRPRRNSDIKLGEIDYKDDSEQ